MKVAIIKYNAGNVQSVLYALQRLGIHAFVTDVHEEIKHRRPLITLLTSKYLRATKPDFNMHFNAITGIDKKYIYINDPSGNPQHGGRHKFKIEDYFYGIYASAFGGADNAALMKIRKKN